MALIDGDNAVLDDPLPYTIYNEIKNHWRGATVPANAQIGMIWSDSDDDRLYHITGTGPITSNQIAQGAIMPVATGVRLTEPGGADYMDLLLDGTDAFIKWSDGALVLMTDEGADTITVVGIKGKGTGYGILYIFDENEAEWLSLEAQAGVGHIYTAGAAPSTLNLQSVTAQDIKCWSAIAAGNPYFYIYGFGTAAVEWLRMRVEADNDALIEAEHNLMLEAVAGGHVSIPSNFLNFGSASVGIVGGVITATCTWMKVSPEAAAHDNLDTINGGAEGDILILTNENATWNVVVKDDSDNIDLDGADYTLTANTPKNIALIKIGAVWKELSPR